MKNASSARETAMIQQTSSVTRSPRMRMIGIHTTLPNARGDCEHHGRDAAPEPGGALVDQPAEVKSAKVVGVVGRGVRRPGIARDGRIGRSGGSGLLDRGFGFPLHRGESLNAVAEAGDREPP